MDDIEVESWEMEERDMLTETRYVRTDVAIYGVHKRQSKNFFPDVLSLRINTTLG